MNHWKETADVLARVAELAAAGERAALATVVRISGSAYRRPGAKLLIEERGGTLGSVSGGCLEADVREIAQVVLATGTPCLRHYDTGADEDVVWGLGLGCNGRVDVFVQPATAGPFAERAGRLRELLAGDASFTVATVVDGAETPGASGVEGLGATRIVEADGAVSGSLGSPELDSIAGERARALMTGSRSSSSAVLAIAGRTVFFEALAPPPHLVVCGAGDDARPLVAYAADAGFRVTVLDHRPALLAPEHFPQAARLVLARPENEAVELPAAARSLAVVKTHSLAHDREWTRRLLAAGYPYVGLLGPRARTAAILRDIDAPGTLAERVFGPVGLDLGADGPRQVAVSIVAELLAFVARREPRHLSARREAIHAG
jgi:xanthine/CO dehydrogenase XdhC/CoxF family maturation factor